MTLTSDSPVESTYLSVVKSQEEQRTARASIACVIPAYNEEDTIPEVLTSLLDQSRLPDVIHVVINNSDDETFFDPDGALVHTGDLSTALGKTTSETRDAGTWKYEIRAHYKVPGSTNIWSGLPLKGDVRCR